MNEPISRQQTIFDAAVRLDSPAERATLLDRECGGDAGLRAAVEDLLQSHAELEAEFLGAPVDVVPSGTILLPVPAPGTPVPAGTIVLGAPVAAPGGTIELGAAPARLGAATVTLPPEQYQVGGEIARGGMGSILEAEDRKLGRKVAMKVMKLEASASDYARTRFVREATVLARLEHPNIVPIHELGWDAENRLFYTMKLVQGRTLQAVLNGIKEGDKDFIGHYTLDRLLLIFRKICDALALAHSRGVIHRDLKPENVMVGEFGEVLVMDWGIAKILGDVSQAAEESSGGPELAPAHGVRRPESPLSDEPTAPAQAGALHALREFPSPTASEARIPLPPGFQELSEANLKTDPAALTMDGTIMGTPHYMSPEQADGRVSDIDQQSDVFSLGAILYAILTLRPPVEADSPYDVLELIKRGEIRPPTTYNVTTKTGGKGQSLESAAVNPKKYQPLPHCPGGKVPSALSAVTMRALTVDKARRYPTVAAFAADIEKYQNGFATSAEHAGLFTQVRLLVQRHKREFAVGFAAWLVITALAVWFVINLRAKERRAVAEAERATKAEAVAVEKGEAARRSLAKAALNLAEAAQRESNGPEMQAALAQVPEDLRDSTYGYLLDQSDTSIARIRSEGGEIDGVAAHPLRPGVFAIADNGKVILMEVRTGARLLEFDPGFPPRSAGQAKLRVTLAFSPDGERIAVGRRATQGIVIHSARDGAKLLKWEAPSTRHLEFSPDGRLLLHAQDGGGALTVWDAATGQPRWKHEPGGLITGTFTPDSQQVITHGASQPTRLVSAQDGTLVRKLGDRTGIAFAVRPDGRMMVTGKRDADRGKMQGVFLQDAKVAFEFRALDREIQSIAFTPDGARFASVAVLADGRQAIQLWDANTGAPLQTLLGGSGSVSVAIVHPLSGELVVAGQNTRAWNLTGAPAKWTLRNAYARSSIAFWGSDDFVFTAAPGHNAALQKLQTGSPALLWKPPGRDYRRPSVSADGRFAAIGDIVDNSFRNQAQDVFLLCNPGTQTEKAAVFKASYALALLRLSPVGDRLATLQSRRERADVVDANTGRQLSRLEGKDMKKFVELGWVNGGKQLVGLVTAKAQRGLAGSEEWIVLWDAATGKIVRTTTHRTAMDALAVAPDGRRSAEAGADKMVRIRDAATLAVQQEFRAHDGPITALAWHPTKPIVATASADLSVKLWNLETGRRLEEIRGMLIAPTELAFSPSGRRLGCAGNGNPTRIWEPESLR